MEENKHMQEPMKTGFIFIDSYADKNPEGRLWYSHMGEERKFSNLMQLILGVKDALDKLEFPNEYFTIKSFAPTMKKDFVPADEPTAPPEAPDGRLARFKLKIIFRQNASWQGTLSWIEGKQELSFRSMLELLMMLDSALTQTQPDLLGQSGIPGTAKEDVVNKEKRKC